MINKRGATLTAWIFGIMLVLLFIVILETQILSPMNTTYNKTISTGLNTSYLDSFTTLKQTTHSQIEGAEVTQTADGLTLKSAWSIGKGMYSTIVGFIDGTFINNLFAILDFPAIVGQVVVVMIWISLILIIIYIFMKVVP